MLRIDSLSLKIPKINVTRAGVKALWLVRSTPDRVFRVQAKTGDIVLCYWTRHFNLIVPISTQVYKWVMD